MPTAYQDMLTVCNAQSVNTNSEIEGHFNRITVLNTRIDALESAGRDRDANIQRGDRTDVIALLNGAQQRLKDQVAIQVKLMDMIMIEAERVSHERSQVSTVIHFLIFLYSL